MKAVSDDAHHIWRFFPLCLAHVSFPTLLSGHSPPARVEKSVRSPSEAVHVPAPRPRIVRFSLSVLERRELEAP